MALPLRLEVTGEWPKGGRRGCPMILPKSPRRNPLNRGDEERRFRSSQRRAARSVGRTFLSRRGLCAASRRRESSP